MDSPQTQPPLPPLPRRRPSVPSATSPVQIHRRPSLQRHPSPSSSRRPPHRPVRQASEIVLPEWQPDSSADRCPICHSGFTFWNRRHHCRKCGRVVCHACSPHRITIPKAFVVHPPPSSCYSPSTPTPAPHRPHRASWGPDSDGAMLRRASSSGDEDDGLQVRICDDCLGRRSPGEIQHSYNTPSGRSVPHPHRYNYSPAPMPYYSSASLPSRRPQGQYYYPVPGSSRRELPAQFRAPRLKETDYCPICTLALPPVDPVTGSEEERERHVQVCISSVEDAGSGGGTPGSVGGMGEMRGRRYTGGARMVVWRAKEKDTWVAGSDGEEEEGEKRKREKAECVICFEEFEEGDVIARLECLCRYHKKCIREWFDRKGNGECPIHAVHE